MRFAETGRQKWKLIVNIFVLFVALTGVARKDLDVTKVSLFESFLIDTFGPIQEVVTDVHRSIRDFFDHYITNVDASKENIKLRQEISQLNMRIFESEETFRENERLKNLLAFGDQLTEKKVLAQVVSWDATSNLKVIRINKGSRDGVKLQSVVVTAEGLVGYVNRLTKHYADILTIVDANNRVDGIISRIRSHGIVEGDSTDRCIMKFVTRTEPVELNDTVVTSGLGFIYPKGIKVGNVSKIERASYGITQYIEILPSVDFNRIEEVVVLVDKDDELLRKEWEALDNTPGAN